MSEFIDLYIWSGPSVQYPYHTVYAFKSVHEGRFFEVWKAHGDNQVDALQSLNSGKRTLVTTLFRQNNLFSLDPKQEFIFL